MLCVWDQWFADEEVVAKKTAEGKVKQRNRGELSLFFLSFLSSPHTLLVLAVARVTLAAWDIKDEL